ncbi:hypothetical protein SCLCIDRAFT_33468 [Scleroderma citrinum Foug A]|uniref:Uncharacterized protein n=1 Tax=Scleroderma citrinum Foug A TaxID=1036808 RepID=A0A0C2ZEP0_9AGAM|nr:hypothetical protein SCLCIDRAFT_33468 [Scleroderma citrinum Foug A]
MLDNIWNLAHPAHLDTAQTIWNRKMMDVSHTLALNDKPVFYLLKQHTYEWCSGMGDRAVKAVKAFFDQYKEFGTPEVRAGWKTFIPPQLYPYMWQVVDESDPENLVAQGPFQHECILDTCQIQVFSRSKSRRILDLGDEDGRAEVGLGRE